MDTIGMQQGEVTCQSLLGVKDSNQNITLFLVFIFLLSDLLYERNLPGHSRKEKD